MTQQPINSRLESPVDGSLSSDGDITIRIEKNIKKIKEIILNKELISHLLQDKRNLMREISHYQNKPYFAYIMNEGDKDFGIVTLEYLPKVKLGLVECGVLQDYRGKKAKSAINLIMKHIYKKNPTIQLLGRINKNNRKSYFFSKMFGFKLKYDTGTHYIVTR
jgi:hypothetical protein